MPKKGRSSIGYKRPKKKKLEEAVAGRAAPEDLEDDEEAEEEPPLHPQPSPEPVPSPPPAMVDAGAQELDAATQHNEIMRARLLAAKDAVRTAEKYVLKREKKWRKVRETYIESGKSASGITRAS
jgi:CO dehydrogenase/acetyl-CoA synthase beta subunit